MSQPALTEEDCAMPQPALTEEGCCAIPQPALTEEDCAMPQPALTVEGCCQSILKHPHGHIRLKLDANLGLYFYEVHFSGQTILVLLF